MQMGVATPKGIVSFQSWDVWRFGGEEDENMGDGLTQQRLDVILKLLWRKLPPKPRSSSKEERRERRRREAVSGRAVDYMGQN